MAHVVQAWRTSRTIRVFVLVALFGIVTQLLLSQENREVQNGTRQTKLIGSDRLVSVEPLPEMAEICIDPQAANPELIASFEPPKPVSSPMASLPQQRPGGTEAVTPAPPRPSDAARQDVAKRR